MRVISRATFAGMQFQTDDNPNKPLLKITPPKGPFHVEVVEMEGKPTGPKYKAQIVGAGLMAGISGHEPGSVKRRVEGQFREKLVDWQDA